MVVYHTRYRNDWQRSEDNGALAFSSASLRVYDSSLSVVPLTLSVNTTPIFHTWYFVSIELNLKEESSDVIFSA